MEQTKKIVDTLEHGKNPNFLLIVVLSGLALIGLFIAAWLLVGDKGRKLLPGLHHDPQPTSSIRRLNLLDGSQLTTAVIQPESV
jgi:hypothetical protein